jgi:hypothetical protein
MAGPLEFSARAALCRRLARREPNSKVLWLAEAERWSRLTVAPRSRPPQADPHHLGPDSGLLARWCGPRIFSGRC